MDAETVTLQQEREQLQKEIANKHQEYKEQIEELQGEHDDLLSRLKRATKVNKWYFSHKLWPITLCRIVDIQKYTLSFSKEMI